MTTLKSQIAERLKVYADSQYDHLRPGQKLMTALGDVNMGGYRLISNTTADCFYRDDRIPNFWSTINTLDISRSISA